MYQAIFKQTEQAAQMGEYKPTKMDEMKAAVDFRLLQVSPFVIRWKSGDMQTLNKRELNKLQKNFTWATDF